MKTVEVKTKLIRAAKELKKYLVENEDYRSQTVERAFIDWYLKARFGDAKDRQIIVTDGKNDGGIDALVISDKKREVYIFQMKYEKEPRLSGLVRDELAGFEKVRRILCDDLSSDFDNWIETVRSDIKAKYIETSENIKRKKYRAIFCLVTTKKSNFLSSSIQCEDANNVLALWELYQEGFTPPAEVLQLRIRNPITVEEDRYTTYVGLAEIQDFRKAMSKDVNERLFAQNVRTNLKSGINENIQQTYESESDVFWLGNNGVYIVCKDVQSTGSSYTLTYPSIINGSQTLHSIHESKKENDAKILVRILKLNYKNDTDRLLLNNIIRRTNSQNAMKPVNLFAHDACQLNIARHLHGWRVFYERREKEWSREKRGLLQGFSVVSLKEVAQWLSTLHAEIGLGPARTNVAALFNEDNYDLIFADYATDKFDSLQYSTIVPLVWCGVFTRYLVKSIDGERYLSRAKIAQLLLVKMLYQIVISDRDIQDVIKNRKLEKAEFGRKSIPKEIKNVYKKVIDGLISVQSQQQRQNEKLDFSNFFKRRHLPESAYKKIVTKTLRNKLHQVLKKQICSIY